MVYSLQFPFVLHVHSKRCIDVSIELVGERLNQNLQLKISIVGTEGKYTIGKSRERTIRQILSGKM